MAAAELELEFEHRDLHWGNVLVSAESAAKTMTVAVGDATVIVPNHGVRAVIIDYTLSRIRLASGVLLHVNLSDDPDLFTGENDTQFDVYREMRQTTGEDWEGFHAKVSLEVAGAFPSHTSCSDVAFPPILCHCDVRPTFTGCTTCWASCWTRSWTTRPPPAVCCSFFHYALWVSHTHAHFPIQFVSFLSSSSTGRCGKGHAEAAQEARGQARSGVHSGPGAERTVLCQACGAAAGDRVDT